MNKSINISDTVTFVIIKCNIGIQGEKRKSLPLLGRVGMFIFVEVKTAFKTQYLFIY